MQLEPYLFFHGRCEEALNFYKDCLRGEISELNRFAGSPMESEVSSDYKNKIMHASFVAGDVKFMASDGRPGRCGALANDRRRGRRPARLRRTR
jgi:PhnB protein